MKIRISASFSLLLLLAACASTGDAQREKAARINADLSLEYLRQGNLNAALDMVDRALKQDPRNPSVQLVAALVNQKLERDDRAERHFKAAHKLNPDDPELLNLYGVFLCTHQRAEEGEKLLLEAAKNPLYRTPAVAYENAGVCVQSAGRTADAQAYFKRARSSR